MVDPVTALVCCQLGPVLTMLAVRTGLGNHPQSLSLPTEDQDLGNLLSHP